MLSSFAKRAFSSTAINPYKVTVLGANGSIGQPLSLLLKLNDKVTDLRLYDLRGAKGVASDLSHIPTNSTVTGFTPEEDNGLKNALKDTEIVLIPAGVPRKPGMSRDDLFNVNAGIVRDLASACADYAPNAAILIISNPVNSTMPIVSEVLKAKKVYNPKKVFGVTTLDVIRASRFISEIQNTNPTQEKVTVVGGHSGITIIPLISQTKHNNIPKEQLDKLVHRIQFGGDEVVQAKNGAGSASLSMAQAGARFANSVMRGFDGEMNVVESTFVDSPLYKDEGIDFFASPVTLGPEGVAEIHPVGELSSVEKEMLDTCKETLKKNIERGKNFVNQA